MRTIWKGTISFGLVSIPVKLYSAVDQQSMGFRMLCKKCNTPVKYKKYCPGCKEDVSMSDIVKGLEIAKDEYITFTEEELNKLRPEKSDRVEIKEFVDSQEIDPIYYDKAYYCGPDRAKDRAYYLIKEVLKTSDKVAIGRFVMRQKEYVCAIRDFKSGLLLSTLNYKYEIRDIDDIKELKEQPELNKKEIDLAIKLVNQLYEEEFDISDFKDTFADQLKAQIEARDKGEKQVKRKPKMEKQPLLEALKASLK